MNMETRLLDGQCYELRGALTDTCPICLDIFHSPKTLPCGHSYCSMCLQYLSQTLKDQFLNCPMCKRPYPKLVISQLKVNKTLQVASQQGENNSHMHTDERPNTTFHLAELKLKHKLFDDKLLFHKEVKTCLVLPNSDICMNTSDAVYFYNSHTSAAPTLYCKAEYKDVSSMALLLDEVYIIQRLHRVHWTGEHFSSWVVTVLNLNGTQIRQFYAGLGEEATISALESMQRIAVCDSGSYRHHAKPSIILTDNQGKQRHNLEPKKRFLKPKTVIGLSMSKHLVVLDSGSCQIICFTISGSRNSMDQVWTCHTPSNSNIAHHSSSNCILVSTNKQVYTMDSSGTKLAVISGLWDRLVSSISISQSVLAVGCGTACYVYDIEPKNNETLSKAIPV